MKRIFSALTVLTAALLVTACTKCTQDKPMDPPAVVEPTPGTEGMGTSMPGDMSAAPAVEETAPAK